MTERANSALMALVLVVLLGAILSCRPPGGLYDLERVGPQDMGYLFRRTLERKVKMDELRAIQCPCVPESGIDVDRYTVDFRDSFEREEYEKARAILIGLNRELGNYDRGLTEARCHWTVSPEKFKLPDVPVECPAAK